MARRFILLAGFASLVGCNAVFGLSELDGPGAGDDETGVASDAEPVDSTTVDSGGDDAQGDDGTNEETSLDALADTNAPNQDSAISDAGGNDGGTDTTLVEASSADSATTDSASTDSATTDSATTDSATTDSATTDTATTDSATTDTKPLDTGTPDTKPLDTGTPDTGTPDTGDPCTVSALSTPQWTKLITAPGDEWINTRGGFQKTPDGNFIAAGSARASIADGGLANPNGYLVKIDPNGDKIWSQTYGGAASSDFLSVISLGTSYLACGACGTGMGGCTAARHCGVCVKADGSGVATFTKAYGGTANDVFSVQSLAPATGGGVMSSGYTTDSDAWIDGLTMAIDANATASTRKTVSADGEDNFGDLVLAPNGSYYAVGSLSGWRTCQQPWLAHFDAAGTKISTYGLGPCSNDNMYSGARRGGGTTVLPLADGTVVVAGYEWVDPKKRQGFLVKVANIDTTPAQVWRRSFGGNEEDFVNGLEQLGDGGFLLVGTTGSQGAGGTDMWVVRTDSAGNEVWSKTYGGTGNETGLGVRKHPDGSWVLAGTTRSSPAQGQDLYLVKIKAECATSGTGD